MQTPARKEDEFSLINVHDFVPFDKGHFDVRLPSPNSDIRLLIFRPNDYPYLWLKYVEGLKREYTRMQVNHILDLDGLSNPNYAPLAMLAIVKGEIVAGLRIHGPLRKADDAAVLEEMADGNHQLLRQYVQEWLSEGVIEPKGMWLNVDHIFRKKLVALMARAGIYGSLILGCRYIVCSCPKNIKKIHFELGMYDLPDIGVVAYPTERYSTSCGYGDVNSVLKRCNEDNHDLLSKEWMVIHQNQILANSRKKAIFSPIILSQSNPFQASSIESLLMDDEYEKISYIDKIDCECRSLLPVIDDKKQQPENRWVIYPWRKVAAELPDSKTLKRLRHDRNRNKITQAEQEELSTLSIGVVGLSTGHVIAHTLVMEGLCGHLKLADFDDLEVSNLNRIPASLLDVGENKAVITARRIAELDPYVNIEVFDEGLQQSNIESFIGGLDIVIEECDSLDIKLLVREVAAKHKIPVLMSTSDLGMIDVERFDLEDNLKPFHGLIDISTGELRDLSRLDKARHGLSIVEGDRISARLAASMTEIGHTLRTWPQLASDVTQGAAMIATAVRRIGTGKMTPTSRTRVDMDKILRDGGLPEGSIKIGDQSTQKPEFSGGPRQDMLLAARYAPSAGNIQPWKICWDGGQLDFEIDRKLTTIRDICWRASMVSIGAACFNAEVVAAHYGLSGSLIFFPDPDQPDLVASWVPDENASFPDYDLFPLLLARTTNRQLSPRKALPLGTISKLKEITQHYAVSLHIMDRPEDLRDYAGVSAESDRLRHICTHLHREIVEELVWPGEHSLEQGIDIRTLGLDEKDLNVMPVIERKDVMHELAEWNAGYALGDYSRDRISTASAMVVIGVKEQSDAAYLEGGRALEHFWLMAQQEGLAVQPISPVFLYANSKDEVRHLMQDNYVDEILQLKTGFKELFGMNEGDYPVLVLRLFYAKEPEFYSLRREIM